MGQKSKASNTDEDITINGELVIYRLNTLDDKVNSVLVKIDNSLATKAYVDAKYEDLDKRLKPFEEARKWIVATVAGVIVLALLGLIIRSN